MGHAANVTVPNRDCDRKKKWAEAELRPLAGGLTRSMGATAGTVQRTLGVVAILHMVALLA